MVMGRKIEEIAVKSSRRPMASRKTTYARLASRLQGDLGEDETGMLFSAANFRRSCRPWKRLKNLGMRHGAMIDTLGSSARQANSNLT
jgi:hypothetical protein